MLHRQVVYKNKNIEIIGYDIGCYDEHYFVNFLDFRGNNKCIYDAYTIEECKEFIRNIDFDKYYF